MWKLFLDLVFPEICQGCGIEGIYFCLECQAKIKSPSQRCFVCSRDSFLGQIHPECQSQKVFLAGVLVVAPYENRGIQDLIRYLKYYSVRPIGKMLGQLMADFLISLDLVDYFAGSAVVPVPLHKRRLRSRGFNQAEILASDVAGRMNWELLPILTKARSTQSQVDLKKEERLENLKGVFACSRGLSLEGRKILLVDDVASTAATLNECAKVLKKQRASEVWGLVVARN